MNTPRTVLITGPTSGIGRITAFALAQKGYKLILLARDHAKVTALQKELSEYGEAYIVIADLADLQSVRRAVAQIKRDFTSLDVLINNAGLIVDTYERSAQGYELTFAINHLGHFLLTTELIDLLKAGRAPRIVHVSSEAHRIGGFKISELAQPASYKSWVAYGSSKLANILFSNELARRLAPEGITSNALHPGAVATNFAGNTGGFTRWMMRLAKPFFITEKEGAQTTIYLSSSPEVEGKSGGYYAKSRLKTPNRDAQSTYLATELWKLSEALIKA